MTNHDRGPPGSEPPGAWPRAWRAVRAAGRPIEAFLHVESAGGVLLIIAGGIAVAWASSPFASHYERLLHTTIGIRLAAVEWSIDLHFLVNDVLMTLFFFVIGLEIKREIAFGELSQLRRAALPIAAALGGMLVPAGIYLAINPTLPERNGWGVPMATDIAFAVGVLTLLGRRVAPALRVLLLTIAIIDDIGAVVVIAAFYSTGITAAGLAIAAAGVLATLVLQSVGARSLVLYLLAGAVVWTGLHRAGVHPTMAGVIVGMLTPARAWLGPRGFTSLVRTTLAHVDALVRRERADPGALAQPLRDIERARREALSPVERLSLALHPWVAWLIVPLFAFANAGVRIDGASMFQETRSVVLGIVFGLALGKPLGILLGSALVVATRVTSLPCGVTWRGVLVVGAVAGIGFTMAIFVANLAFDEALLAPAKLAILGGSVLAGAAGYLLGRWLLSEESSSDEALTEARVEAPAVS